MTAERIYVGSYTTQDGGGDGIGFGPVGELGLAVTTADPSFLARYGRFLFATNEEAEGRVSAFEIQPDGALKSLNHQSTGGAHPCHLTVDPSGRYLLSANYGSGSVAIHPIAEDGSLGEATQILQREGTGPNADRQEGPHAHQVVFDPAGEYAFDVDLGSDTVHISRLTESGQLEEVGRVQIHPGAGPRHLAFNPRGGAAYVINELDSTLTVCSYDRGELRVVGTVSTRPDDATGENYPAELLVSGDGRFLYGSNRGDDTIAVFTVSPDGLSVELVQTVPSGGSWPRHLAFGADGTSLYAANERTDAFAVLTVDPETGLLTPGPTYNWPKPVCVVPL